MIFDLDSLSNQYSQKEIAYLNTTSIDYALCDYSDKPILCIEFDGLCQGFSVGNKYSSRLAVVFSNRVAAKISSLLPLILHLQLTFGDVINTAPEVESSMKLGELHEKPLSGLLQE